MTPEETKKKMDELLKSVEDELNAATPLTKEQKAEDIILTAQVYMDAMSQINENYTEALTDLMEELKELKERQDEVGEAQKLTKVRIKLFE